MPSSSTSATDVRRIQTSDPSLRMQRFSYWYVSRVPSIISWKKHEVLLDVVGMRVLAELHRLQLGRGVAEHLLDRAVRLDEAARAMRAQDAHRGAVEDRPVAEEGLVLGGVALLLAHDGVVALVLRTLEVGDLDDRRGDADDLAVARDDRRSGSARNQRQFSGSPDRPRRPRARGGNAALEHGERRGHDLRGEVRQHVADQTADDLRGRLVAEDAEGAVRADDAQIAVDDRDADRLLLDERVEQRIRLERGAAGVARVGLTTTRQRIRRAGHTPGYRPLSQKVE